MSDDNDERFQRLWQYYDRLVSFIQQFGFEREAARDLAQDTFLRVYQHIESYRGDAKWNFLETTARHLAYNAIRDAKAAKRNGIMVPEEVLTEQADPHALRPDSQLHKKEISERLRSAIDQLKPSQKICVEYFYLGENSYDEICSILDISLPALKSRLNAARKELKELLGEEPEGWAGDDS